MKIVEVLIVVYHYHYLSESDLVEHTYDLFSENSVITIVCMLSGL